MKNIQYPDILEWEELSRRPSLDSKELGENVSKIMGEVKAGGDDALNRFNKEFDGVDTEKLRVDLGEREFVIDPDLGAAIKMAETNISKFHANQIVDSTQIETSTGVNCWRKSVPIEKVGLYIPGGSAPLFSTLLMLAIPAKLAGCQEIIVCTPPQKISELNDIIGWSCQLLGIKEVFLTGGAQAIAAMTYGTESVPKVDKIFGPGNQFVTEAKQQAQKAGVAIDMPAGPSEVLIIADEHADPIFMAADLLSQAEHGADSQVVLVSDSQEMIKKTENEVQKQLEALPRKEIALRALKNSKSILTKTLDEAMAFSNVYAPEHLIIATVNNEELSEKVTNAGSVFLGNWSCESAGDYASGTNHTLPTNGYARAYSGVSLDSFMKKNHLSKIDRGRNRTIRPGH